MKLSEIKQNLDNPRIIKDERFKKLVQSIKDFPKMMELRPIVIDKQGKILGGNMRFKALQELKYKEVPEGWIKRADELTDDEIRRFIIVDNIGFGENDWEMLSNVWDTKELIEWGLEIVNFDNPDEDREIDLSNDLKETYEVIIECTSEREQETVFNNMKKDGYKCRVLTL